jgi:polysaccharide deacetylase family protein (PEP-CTERM system associated)
MTLSPAQRTTHFFTVDVEEYFQVSAFDSAIPRSEWDRLPSRIEHNVDLLLDLLAKHGVTGTFFVLGWIASRHPRVVRSIAAAGHEVASHGYWHRRVASQTPEEFRADVRAAKDALEQVCGMGVTGYRAPSFSILPGGEWAFDVLLEEGYHYDSSLFPVRRSGYGYPLAPPIPHVITRGSGALLEFPLATTTVRGMRIPAAGGGYLRHFPFGLIRRAFRESTEAGVPAAFYIHPWELDPDQPRLDVPLLTRVRHYRGLRDTAAKVERLLGEMRFSSIAHGISAMMAAAAEAAPGGPRTSAEAIRQAALR